MKKKKKFYNVDTWKVGVSDGVDRTVEVGVRQDRKRNRTGRLDAAERGRKERDWQRQAAAQPG